VTGSVWFDHQRDTLAAPDSSRWEGTATVSGSASGRADVELVGYCD